MKIIELEAENVKRLKAVRIRPEGNVVVIEGQNEQGKSSVLDSIEMALGGRGAQPSQPVRSGQKKARIVCELDNGLVVKRTITAKGGGTLVVENKNMEGAVYRSPQSILNALVGELTFDPLAFSKMDGKKQLETLKDLVGLDFTELDQKRQRLYDARSAVNLTVKRLKIALESLPEFPDAPEKEVSVKELMEELKSREDANKSLLDAKMKLKSDILTISQEREDLDNLAQEIEELEEKLKALRESKEDREKNYVEYSKAIQDEKKRLDGIEEEDEQEIRDKIEASEAQNEQVRANLKRDECQGEIDKTMGEVREITAQINGVDGEKEMMLAEAKFPVDGLSFGTSEVMYNDVPFSQASQAGKLRVSVAMGLALNPKLKVLLIRDGSHLDDKNRKLISEMAQREDAQLWIEVVGRGNEASVVIEDGMVLEEEKDD